MDQETAFLNGEGDNWFLRNRSQLTNSQKVEGDSVLRLVEMFRLTPRKVLEVGASNGVCLAAIAEKYDATCFGIDPSEKAIKDGNERYPSLRLYKGVASGLPFDDEEFDLVVANFVFHWVDRGRLLKSVSEIDRVLQWGGYLAIGDFLPPSPCRTKYHHLPTAGVWTYKQDYSQLFTASSLYHLVGGITGSHSNHEISAEVLSTDRTATFLLQKKAEYVEVKLKGEDRAHKYS